MTASLFTNTHIKLMNTDIYCTYNLNDKPPIVLIHGFVASSYTFHPIMPLLTQYFSVLALDLPGFGRSEKSTTFRYTYENYANLIIALLDHFNLGRVHIAGHSMGGQIALYTAQANPDRVGKLVLINSSAYWGRVYKWARMATYLPFSHLVMKRVVQKNDVEDTLKNVLYDSSHITEELIREYGSPLKEKKFYKALGRFIRQREGDLTRDELLQIHTPTLLIWGKDDNVVPLVAGKQLVNDLPHATLISYDKAGHLITEEYPEAINENIREWCLAAE